MRKRKFWKTKLNLNHSKASISYLQLTHKKIYLQKQKSLKLSKQIATFQQLCLKNKITLCYAYVYFILY